MNHIQKQIRGINLSESYQNKKYLQTKIKQENALSVYSIFAILKLG